MARDDTKANWRTAVADAARALSDTPLPFLVGMALIIAAGRWDGSFHDRKGCFQLQEIKGKIFKVDACTGKVEEVKSESTNSGPKNAAVESKKKAPGEN